MTAFMHVTNWAALASAIGVFAAAAAALASWLSVKQARAAWRAALYPFLHASFRYDGKNVVVELRNLGGGVGRLVHIRIAFANRTYETEFERYFLMGGEGYQLTSENFIQAGPIRPYVVMTCTDFEGTVRAFSLDLGERHWRYPHVRLPRIRLDRLSLYRKWLQRGGRYRGRAFKAIYPEVDLDALTAIQFTGKFLPKQ